MRKKSGFISKICVPLLSMVMIAGAIPHMTARAEVPPLENKQTPEESDAAAFRRIGEAFYNKYIKNKYQNPGGGTDVLTLEGIYALEYAMNKDLLSDEAVAELTTGEGKVVDLPTYIRTVNSLCAVLLDVFPKGRRSTDAPEKLPADLRSVDDRIAEREWGDGGVPTPDFSELTLTGRDLAGCMSAMEYIHRQDQIAGVFSEDQDTAVQEGYLQAEAEK